ncbi:MAG: hypothetical protein ACLR0I_09645 [Streptococcus salivarius]
MQVRNSPEAKQTSAKVATMIDVYKSLQTADWLAPETREKL